MSVRRVQFRRGTTAENSAFTGAVGELTVNTTTKAVRVHDGSTQGGTELARADLDNFNIAPNGTVDFLDSDGDATVRLINIADPTNAQDAATRAWVLSTINGGEVVLNELGDVTINAPADAHILTYDSTLDGDGEWKNVAISGDVTMNKSGVTAIGNLKVTNAMLAGSIANNKLTNSTITFADADSNTSVALGGTITFQGVANETTVENVAGTYTIGLPDDITIQNDLSVLRDLSVGRNVVITGNLTVNGDTTTINTTTLSTEDVVIELAKGASGAANATTDAGLLMTRGSTEAPAVIAWDEGVDKFIIATAQGATGATTDFSGVGITLDYQNVVVGGLEATKDSSITASLTIQGDNEDFLIKTQAGTTKFSVDTDNGNTLIQGTLEVNGTTTLNGLVLDTSTTITTTGGNTSFDGNNVSTTGTITGNALVSTTSITGASASITNNTSTGTLTVSSTSSLSGDLTLTNDTSLHIESATNPADALIIVNSDLAGHASQDAKIIVVERGTSGSDATFEWDEDADKWVLSNNVDVGNNLSVSGTATVTGITTLNSTTTVNANLLVKNGGDTNFQVTQATGATTIAGLLSANGGIAVDTDKFTVADATGNTSIDGTLAVNGISTLSNQLKVQGGNNLTVYSDVGTTAKFTVTGTNGNTDIQGTLNVEGATEIDDTLNVTGATTLQTTLGVTGITTLTGLLNANGGIAVDTDKFTVAGDGTGDTAIAGILGVTGATTLTGQLNANGGINADSGKFIVADGTGITTLGTDASLKINKQTVTTNPVIVLNADRTGNGEEADVVAIEVERGALTNSYIKWNETSDSWNTASNIEQIGAVSFTTGTGAVSLKGNTTIDGNKTFTSGTGNVSLLGSTSVKASFTTIDGLDATTFSIDNTNGNTRAYGTFTSDGANTLKSTTEMQNDLTVKNGSGGANVLFVDVSVPSVAVTGALSVSGITTLSEDLKIQNSNDLIIYSDNPGTVEKFKVLGATGDTTIAGTLGVTDATTLSSTLGVTGISTLTGLLNANGGIAVDTDKFTVAGDGTGDTAIAGTLGVTGITTLTGLLNANGGIAVDSSNFTVNGTTGATAIASTLTVDGITTVKDDLLLHGGAGKDFIIYSDAGVTPKFTVLSSTGNTSVVGTLGVTGATTLSSTLGVTGVSTFSSTIQPNTDSSTNIGTDLIRWATLFVDDITTTSSVTANTLLINSTATITGEVNINGGLKLDTDKFIVADTTGNTTIAGTTSLKSTLTVEDDLTVKNGSGGSNTFVIDAPTGNTTVSGTMQIVGASKLQDNVTIEGTTKTFAIKDAVDGNTKFSVLSASGNTDIKGTLNVDGQVDLNGVVNIDGATLIDDTLQVTGLSTLAGITSTSFSTSASSVTLNSAGTVQDVSIIVERGANDTSIKWNETSDKWTLTENGTNFYEILNSNTTVFNATNGTTNKAFVSGNTLTLQGDGQNVSVSHGGNGTFTFGLSNAIVLDGSLTVTGNATFNGAQLRLKDPLFFIGDSNTSTVNHVGFFGKYEDGIGTILYSGLAYQPGNSRFVLFANNTTATATSSQVTPSGNEFANLTLGSLSVTSDGQSVITLNSDLGASNPTADVGITIERGNYTDAKLYWDETTDNRWKISNPADDNNASSGSVVITSTASEGSRYAINTPTFSANATTISAPATAYINKNAYFLSNGGVGATVNLFALSGTTYDGYVIVFVNTDATATMIVDADGAQTISGSATSSILPGASLSLIANGTSWYII